MPDVIILATQTTSSYDFSFVIRENPLLVIVLFAVGLLVGLLGGLFYSFGRANMSKSQADQKLRKVVASFEQEKNVSEQLLSKLEVGILAYGGDGHLLKDNPAARAILGMAASPKSLSAFLEQYDKENDMQAAMVLQSSDIAGRVNVQDRIARLRLTKVQLGFYRKASWIVIVQDITEQEREERQRKEFVANVSHELKTPLTTISAYSETLLDWGLEGKKIDDVRTDIMRIYDDTSRMDALVNNLLLLSSIDSRGIRPNMSQYDIVYIMRQVISRLAVQAKEKIITVDSAVLSIIPPVFGDPSAMDRILTNLISNAIKYTDPNGRVRVSIQLTNDYISIKVADNGMGVAKDNLSLLFNRFYRVDPTGSRKHGGTGLGLSIAKELTELQGGRISVSSVWGKGTEFVVTVPKAEKTYRETLTSVIDGAPRREILYENAQTFLLMAVEEMRMNVRSLDQMSDDAIQKLLAYILYEPEAKGPQVLPKVSPQPQKKPAQPVSKPAPSKPISPPTKTTGDKPQVVLPKRKETPAARQAVKPATRDKEPSDRIVNERTRAAAKVRQGRDYAPGRAKKDSKG